MSYWIIYLIRNKQNGKIYIGQTKQKLVSRWYKHRWLAAKNSMLPLHNAIRKYGKEEFSVEIIAKDLSSQEDADSCEIHWISYYHSAEKEFGYNVEAGGQHNRSPLSEDTKEKMRNSDHSKKMKTPEMRAHMSAKTIAFFADPINREKSSKAAHQRVIDDPSILLKIGESNSKAIKTKWEDPEYRAKQIESRKAKWADPEYKAMMRAAMKKKKLDQQEVSTKDY